MSEMFYAEVVENSPLLDDVFDLYLYAPDAVKAAQAGQFLSLFTGNPAQLLPRPLSLCDIDKKRGIFRIIYRVVGSGTAELAKLSKGDKVRVLGALGSHYQLQAKHKSFALLGGGMGAPPMLALAKKIRNEMPDAHIVTFLGFRDKSHVMLEQDFKKYADTVLVATDDGSYGIKGNSVGVLKDNFSSFDTFFACGPHVMLKHLAQFANEQNMPCFVSIEERMACSIGACLACVCKVVTDDETGFTYKRVCSHGPVFNAKELVWE